MKARIVSVGVDDGRTVIDVRLAAENGGATFRLNGGNESNAAIIAANGWLAIDAEMEIKLTNGDKWMVLS